MTFFIWVLKELCWLNYHFIWSICCIITERIWTTLMSPFFNFNFCPSSLSSDSDIFSLLKVTGKVSRTKRQSTTLGDGAVGTERDCFHVEFDSTDTNGTSVFVKIQSMKIWLHAFLLTFGLYKNEVFFYQHISQTVPSDLRPRCYLAKI